MQSKKNHLFWAFGISIALFFTSPAFGFDFSSADKSYAEREKGLDKVEEARAKYMVALRSASGKDLVKTVTRLARLDYYEAIQLHESETTRIKAIFERCLGYIDKLAPMNSAEYYFWKSGCLSGWAFADGGVAALAKIKEAWTLLEKCWAIDPLYEGGGCYRLAGGILGEERLPPVSLTGGPARNYQKSKEYLEIAMGSDSSSNIDETFARNTETGEYFYAAHYFYALTLKRSGDSETAKAILDDAIARGDSNDYPKGREAESHAEMARVKQLRAQLN